MPHLVRWHEQLSEFGLVVVAPHVQGGPADDVKAKAEALGVRFPVTAGGSVAGADRDGLPFCVVFDHAGKAVHQGSPAEAEAKVRAAVGEGLLAAAGISEPARGLKPVADALRKGGPPLDALRKLTGLKGSGDRATADQAKALAAAILDGGQKKLDAARESAKGEPVAAYDAAARLAAAWKGTPVGTGAAELVAKLKGDKVVAAELKVRPQLETVKKLDAAMSAAGKGADAKSAEFKKAFAAQLRQLNAAVGQMKRSAPDAKATKEAEEIAGKYDLPGK